MMQIKGGMMQKPLEKLTLSIAISTAFFPLFFAPAYAQQKISDHQPPPDIAGSIQAVKNLVEVDEDMISRGSAPPVLLQYDKQLLALVTEGADIWAKHDQARAREFGVRYNAIMAARDAAQAPYLAASRARAHEAAARAADAKAGADEARAQAEAGTRWSRPQSTGPHPCPTGPGAGEVQVGVAAGEPICQ